MIQLRDYQEEAIQSIFQYYRSGKRGNPLVMAPTGSGKSIIIAEFCRRVTEKWSSQKILVISHVKEILEQNYAAIKKLVGNSTVGLYSSGLKSRDISGITVAGIQSIYNKPELFDEFNIILVDEAHTIPHKKNGRYHNFFTQVKRPVIGFTATPYRLGTGYLHLGEGAFFDDIIYQIPLRTLQERGYLCKLTAKGTKKRLDAKGIKKQGGDFILRELSMAFDRETITKDIANELVIYKNLRKKWLVFAIDIEHAENVTAELNSVGIPSACVHSKMEGSRDKIINDFKVGKYQALVSVAVLTTGFDVPDVDMIALLRPTSSPVLHVQIIGRGLRYHDDKEDCLVLDFAGNLNRNGPIDAPVIKVAGKGTGEAIMKECDNCYEIVHAAVRICPCCNQAFKFRHKLKSQADEREVVAVEDWHEVEDVKYFKYIGKRNIPMLKVSYFCGLRRFNEYVCLEHPGRTKYIAQWWWKRRSHVDPPDSIDEALGISDSLIVPKKIKVKESGKFPEIIEFDLSS